MSTSVAQENSMPSSARESNKPLELQLPENFKEVHPSMKAEKILPYFRNYLVMLLKKKDSNLNSDSSVSTYQSCAKCWIRRYAQGHELQHVLHKAFVTKTAKEDKTQAVFRRSYPMTRCGLNHLVKMYNLCCDQFHPNIKTRFKKKNINLRKRKRIQVENVPTLNSSMIGQYIQEFIQRYLSSTDGFPTSLEQMKQFLRLFDQYRSERLTETVWELSGIPKDVLMANSYLHKKKDDE
jgi:hypothetical protein